VKWRRSDQHMLSLMNSPRTAPDMWLDSCRSSILVGVTFSTHAYFTRTAKTYLERSWNVMAHGDAREGKWRGNWRMEWISSTLYTTSEHGVSSITTADAHTSAASSRLNWRTGRFKWKRPFRRNTKSGFCVCAITFQTQSNNSTRF
jgi:hypothetical protein